MPTTVERAVQAGGRTVVPAGEELDIRVCRAASGCPRAVADVAGVQGACSAALRDAVAGAALRRVVDGPLLEHHRFKLAISGCPNQCSQPQIADVGLVGRRLPAVDRSACIACGLCVEACAESAIVLSEDGVTLDRQACVGCGACIHACPTAALTVGEQGWSVLVGGRLGRHPRLAAEVDTCATSARAVDRLRSVLELYLLHARPGERLGATLDRLAGVAPGCDGVTGQRESARAGLLAGLLSGEAAGVSRPAEVDLGGAS